MLYLRFIKCRKWVVLARFFRTGMSAYFTKLALGNTFSPIRQILLDLKVEILIYDPTGVVGLFKLQFGRVPLLVNRAKTRTKWMKTAIKDTSIYCIALSRFSLPLNED